MPRLVLAALIGLLLAAPLRAQSEPEPLSIGETFTLESGVLNETRRINVYRPAAYGLAEDAPLPVLYMPDGGIGEDFLHIAGLVQISVLNGTMRPHLLVGIENTERRRDLTGPTSVPEDREIAPRVGGSEAFRAFIRDELMPAVRARYATTDETAIVGESLAGLFVVETLAQEPGLFDTYIAVDPSLWWNGGALADTAPAALADQAATLYLATSEQAQIASLTIRLAGLLGRDAPGVDVRFRYLQGETHGTVYHPAALEAFRTVLGPEGE